MKLKDANNTYIVAGTPKGEVVPNGSFLFGGSGSPDAQDENKVNRTLSSTFMFGSDSIVFFNSKPLQVDALWGLLEKQTGCSYADVDADFRS